MAENSREVNFTYLPHTDKCRQEMLSKIGVKSIEDLLKHIPKEIRIKELEIPSGMSELELNKFLNEIASKNIPSSKLSSFLGGGSYRRYVPAAVNSVVSRSEFATAYTPYQPEVSQGTLQAIYEFQTAICLLTGMEVANASVYDGPTACAEASLMACRVTGRQKVVLSYGLNPEYAMVTSSYLDTCGIEHEKAKTLDGTTNLSDLNLDEAACYIVQYPNYFGCLEDLEKLAEKAHSAGALLVVVTCPISLGLLASPGSFGADIVVGDAQQCGNNLSFGGPSAGFMATLNKYVRQLPGRLCGRTIDNRGQEAFTLTLQTREQHIRRAKATSNICTNQSLNALTMLVYLTLMGPQGLKEITHISMQRAHYLADLITNIEGVKLKFNQAFVHEFLIELDRPASCIVDELKQKNILAGIDIGKKFYPELGDNCLLIAVTEMNSPEELKYYASELKAVMNKSYKSSNAVEKNTVAFAVNK